VEVVIQPDGAAAAAYAGRVVASQIRRKPRTVLGLATGSTPVGLYRELIRLHREEDLDFSQVKTFNLDEYVGLPPDHPQSYHQVIRRAFLNYVNAAPGHVHIPNGMAEDIESECERYEDTIRAAGGIDIQILGMGRTGHIGFNEPGSSLGSRTRLKELTPRTIRDNSRFFPSEAEVPRYSITMGVGTIMDARRCLMMVLGDEKAEILAQAIEGPITAMVTATMLQLHPLATIVVDEAAAARLQLHDHYRWVFEHKPDWQRE
jgi:glucosamine-6-phosphate deaminase